MGPEGISNGKIGRGTVVDTYSLSHYDLVWDGFSGLPTVVDLAELTDNLTHASRKNFYAALVRMHITRINARHLIWVSRLAAKVSMHREERAITAITSSYLTSRLRKPTIDYLSENLQVTWTRKQT